MAFPPGQAHSWPKEDSSNANQAPYLETPPQAQQAFMVLEIETPGLTTFPHESPLSTHRGQGPPLPTLHCIANFWPAVLMPPFQELPLGHLLTAPFCSLLVAVPAFTMSNSPLGPQNVSTPFFPSALFLFLCPMAHSTGYCLGFRRIVSVVRKRGTLHLQEKALAKFLLSNSTPDDLVKLSYRTAPGQRRMHFDKVLESQQSPLLHW